MRAVSDFTNIYLCRRFVDMRKQINGLSLIVESELKQTVVGSSLFIFTNRSRRLVKILYWDRTGFALWMKRYEKEKLHWPKDDAEVVVLNNQQLQWLLDGYNLAKMTPHKTLSYAHNC